MSMESSNSVFLNSFGDDMLRTFARLCAIPTLVGALSVAAQLGEASAASPTAHHRAHAPRVDGFTVCLLPGGVGNLVSDFVYSFDDVDFRSLVWESGPDAAGGYRQDLDVGVLRGQRLTSRGALYRFLTDYEQRPSDEWRFVPFTVHGRPGYLGRDEAFWLVEPGVAIKVSVDRDRFSVADVVLVAEGIRRSHPMRQADPIAA